MSTFANTNFEDSDSEGEDFNPDAHVSSDEDAKPARDARKPAKSVKSAAIIEDSDDDDDIKAPVSHAVDDANGDDAKDDEEVDEDEGDKELDDEDDEEEDEEDEEDRPRKRRRKPNHMQFIDEEAEVDDEDEDEEAEDDEIDETHPDDIAELPVGGENDDYRHRELDRQRERLQDQDALTYAEQLKEKYGRQKNLSMRETSGIPQQLLQPSAEDPQIWSVKCKIGKEYEVVNSMMKRFAERLDTPQAIDICSVFARPNAMSGYIYIEAKKQEAAKKISEYVTFCYAQNMNLIQKNEMPDLLKVRKQKEIKLGAFVRLKRPAKYAGDLAQVELVEETASEVTLRIVPRVDMSQDDGSAKRKRPGAAVSRPPQKLFNEGEARKLGGRYIQGRGKNQFTFQGEDYIGGYCIKTVKFAAVETDNVNPTLEEASKFAITTEGEDGQQNQEIDLNAIAASLRETGTGGDFLPGDVVEIFSGEQQGVRGTAAAVHGDVVTIQVAAGPLKGQKIKAPSKSIRKKFEIGNSVKVLMNSKYRNEVGTVLKVAEDRVTLLTDNGQQEITVLSRDLRVSLDFSTSQLNSQYQLRDLVNLDASTVGCVVRENPETVDVLDQNGNVKQMLPSSIAGKIELRRPTVAADRVGSEIRTEDLVQESAGNQRKGIVIHIHRNFLFLEDKLQTENNGVFVVKSSSVTVISAKGGRGEGANLTEMNPALAGKQTGSFGTMGPPGKPGAGKLPIRNRIDGAECMIAKGAQKGVKGRIKDSTNTHARIEFMNRPGVHSYPLEMLKYKTRNGEWQRLDGTPTAGRVPGSRVPYGSRVPAGVSGGNRSAWGDHGGSGSSSNGAGAQTPYWKGNADGARTPAYGGRTSGWDGSRTVNPYNDGSRTAYGNWDSGNRTPAPYASAPTPGAYGANAATPAGLDAPTPGPYLGAPTPGPVDAPTPRVYAYPTPGASAPTPGAFADTPGAYAAETPGAFTAETPGAFAAETPAAFGDDDDEPRYA
ncbi:transcription elongation factor Spt5 [Microthyrium microscopicum]|uniref:Transcription elongation factor SPT5 n=1 Tax=Microthyrium microscopicum TaxID=703497 RepID=A0A6A6TVK1_9PEZI|nr:transcription elongation factor Spt5 [Microthyrium microscopicum]